ncbi:hypothetical protein [Proteus mirabilis]|uniref:hypothetical protein n=1 Tax=Proteus mirabilis TaxID=584 RepID=UPI001A35B6AD|nr:hypothetical protein [Proteus mirabilis]MBI6376244.1 hypothetical protein [Proteus mirabilis]MBI6464054.1 hypothetical protein [Proteus mirabilis]MBI6503259.1 hypothetical protein [Proteus mirabilis]MCL8619905.1 hypothetical protein [Proteus mirabilis]MCL8630942.1 hypothetical protein [Proteus mirabilis]
MPVWGIFGDNIEIGINPFGEVLEHKKSQRIISTMSLSENQERLIPEFKAFAEKNGVGFIT